MKRYGIVVEQLRRRVPGGIGTYARGLVQGLADALHPEESLLLIASGTKGKSDPLRELGEIYSPLCGAPVGHRIVQRGWDNRLFAAPSGLDVVHATSFAQPPRRVSVKRSERLRTMYVHDLAWRTHPEAYPEAGRIWHERVLARALREVDEFFVPSRATADSLRSASRRDIGIHVIPEGCDHLPSLAPVHMGSSKDPSMVSPMVSSIGSSDLGHSLSNGSMRRASNGSSEAGCHSSDAHGAGYLLTVSTREPRKNLSGLLAGYGLARSMLKAQGLEPCTLRIVGPSGWSGADGDPALPKELPEGVELIGAVSDADLVRQLNGARAFVYVPLVEGYGLPPLEAMRAEIPVVCSLVPSIAEGNREAALIVEPLNAESIATGLVRVLTNEGERDRLLIAGKALADQRTWQRCAADHLVRWRIGA